MKKFICNGCKEHHAVDAESQPKYCLMTGVAVRYDWREVTPATPQKLTAEELAKRGIEWPEEATVAVVATKEGTGLFAKSATMDDSEEHWNCVEPVSLIPGKWDASDWKNSLIQRPEKKEALPDWCKVGAWCWTERTGYFTITEIEGGSCICGKSPNGEGQTVLNEKISEARLRPWTSEEMKQKVGKIFDLEKDSYLAIGFVYENIMLATGGEPTLYTAEGLISMQFTVDNSPCGVLEHREGEGWVR